MAWLAERIMPWRRSILAIGAGVLVTAVLFHFTVDPVHAAYQHALAHAGRRVNLGDWVYVIALTVVRSAPFAIGSILTGAVAPPDKTAHALVTLDLTIVLWIAGVI